MSPLISVFATWHFCNTILLIAQGLAIINVSLRVFWQQKAKAMELVVDNAKEGKIFNLLACIL